MKTQDQTAVVLSKTEATQAETLQAIGKQIILALGTATEKYLELVLYIRRENVAPKLATYELTKLGFKKSRVSEINRVAHANDETFSKYAARELGFDRALAIARVELKGEKAKLTPAGELLKAGEMLEKESETAALKDAVPVKSTKSKSTSPSIQMDAWAHSIFSKAQHVRKAQLPKSWTDGTWTLTLSKAVKTIGS